jgi:hypothetical protein
MNIDLHLEPQTGFLDNTILAEVFPKQRATALLHSNQLRDSWKKHTYVQFYAIQAFENEIKQIEAYLEKHKKNYVPVSYKRQKFQWGRAIIKQSLGFTCFRKPVRNTLLHDSYYDLDLVNAHPSIIVILCIANNIPCPNLTRYVNERSDMLREIAEWYNVDKKLAKDLMLRLCFFGHWKGWKEENNISMTQDFPFLTRFRNELQTIALKLKESNAAMYEACRKKKEEKEGGSEKNVLGSFFSYYLQEWEYRIVSTILKWIIENTTICRKNGVKYPVASYEYDGLKLLKENIDRFGKDAFLQQIIDKTYELTGFQLQWTYKPIEEFYIVDEELYQGEEDVLTDDETSCANASTQEVDGVFNDDEAARKVYKLYPHWKYCQNQLWVFDQKTGMWSAERAAHNAVIHNLQYELTQLVIKKGKPVSTGKSYAVFENLRNRIYSYLVTLCRDDKWLDSKENSSLGKLLFQNGYLQKQETTDSTPENPKFHLVFVPNFNPDIVFFHQIPQNYEPFEDTEYYNRIRERIFYDPLGKAQGDFFIENLAVALMGDRPKRLIFGLGNTNTGKSFLTNAVTCAFGKYVNSFNAENLAQKKFNDGDEARNYRWALLLSRCRVLFSNEMNTNVCLNGNVIKKLSSGSDAITARNHGEGERQLQPHFMLCCFANDLPSIKPYDDAVQARTQVIKFENTFVNKPRGECSKFERPLDPRMKVEIETDKCKQAIIALFIDYYEKYLQNGGFVHMPPEIETAKREWMEGNDDFSELLENFKYTDNTNEYVSSSALTEFLKRQDIDISSQKFVINLKKRAAADHKIVETKKKKIAGKVQNVWTGITWRDDDVV